MTNSVLGALILLLVWVRPHPSGWPTSLTVYAPDVLLACVLLIVLAVNLGRFGALRVRISAFVGVVAVLVYLIGVVVVEPFDPERASALVVAFYLVATVTGISLLADDVPSVRRMLRWENQRVVLGIVFLLALSQALATGPLEEFVHAAWGSERLRNLEFAAPRIYGSFYNANWFGCVSALILVHAIWRVVERRDGLDVVVVLGATATLVATGSRSSLLSALLGVIVVGVVLMKRLRFGTLVRAAGAALVAIATVFALFRTSDVFARSSRFTEIAALMYGGGWVGITSLQGRLEAWTLYASAIAAHPFLGAGQVGGQTTPHNSYLFAMTMFGVPGGVALLSLLTWLTLRSSGICRGGEIGRYASYFTVFLAGGVTAEYWFTTQVFLALTLILIAFRLESGAVTSSA